jgi:hypothetical protein
LVFPVFAQEIKETTLFTKKDIEATEVEIQKVINSKNYKPEEVFNLTVLGARELFQYRHYDKSKIYYRRALEMKVASNKSEAYINLIAIILVENKSIKDNAEVKKLLAESADYYKKNPKFETEDIKAYRESIKSLVAGVPNLDLQTLFPQYELSSSIETLIKEKKYQEVLLSYNPQAVFGATDIDTKIHYDVVNILVNKNKKNELACAATMKKYPDSYSYSVKICKILKEYQDTKKLSSSKLSDLNEYFKTNHSDKSYLARALADLGT